MLFRSEGFKALDEKKTIEALEFYKAIAKASPPGDLFWKQSRELYFAGKAAMIIWSPFILDELAGLRDSAPPTITDDPTSSELASKTGVVTTFSGPSNPDGAAWGDIRYFGITPAAATDAAMDFVQFSMADGHTQPLPEQHHAKGLDKGGFANAWRAGKADPQRLATRFADFGHQCIGLHPVIGPSAFNQRDRAGQRAAVCGDHAFGKGLGFHGGFLHRVGRAVQRFAKKAVVWPWVYAHNQRHDRTAHRRRPARSDRCLRAVAVCGSASAAGRW